MRAVLVAVSPAQLSTVSRTVTASGTGAVKAPARERTRPEIRDSRKTRSAPGRGPSRMRYQWPRQHSSVHGSTWRCSGRAALPLR